MSADFFLLERVEWRGGRDADRPATPPGRFAGYWSWDTESLYVVNSAMEWVDVSAEATPIMTGATSSTAGASGSVPAPSAGEEYYYLRGDGVWAELLTTPTTPNSSAITVPSGRSAYLVGDISISVSGEGTVVIL